ncbi:MAG: ATP-binding protein, partial [Pseudomonadota bacterium]
MVMDTFGVDTRTDGHSTLAEGTPEMEIPIGTSEEDEAALRGGTFESTLANQKVLETEMKRDRTRGYVVRCDGEHATISAVVDKSQAAMENYWAVGQLVTIKVGFNRVVGLTCGVDVARKAWDAENSNEVHIQIELVGEIVDGGEEDSGIFSSGIANYPQMGCIAHRIRSTDLAIIYKNEGDTVVKVGQLTQDQTVEATIEVDKLLSRHFAVVGTTGVGKSTSVTLLMRKIIKARPDIRILILDPHNEFATAFPKDSVVVDSSNLLLPFWLFTLDEFSEVVFRGQEGFDTEIELLRDLIPLAKEQYRAEMENSNSGLVRKKSGKSNLTADMPIPYRLTDLLKIIDDRLGLLDGK